MKEIYLTLERNMEDSNLKEKKFFNIRDHIENAINKYPDNIAFKIKEKNGKKVQYINITYRKMRKRYFCIRNSNKFYDKR